MAKSVAAGMKAAWEAAKKDFKENANTDLLKQDVIDVLDMAKRKASILSSKKASPLSQRKSNSTLPGGEKIGPKVNQDVGAELLTHFKDEWADIHKSTEESSRRATEMDSHLKQINQSIMRSCAIMNKCKEEFGCLKDVVEALDEAHSKVESIIDLIHQVEQDIHNYSLVKVELKVERQKHSLQRQHEQQTLENRTKVEHLRKVLLNEQQLSLSVKHELEMKELSERQSTFQELFVKQMADYRTRGEVDKPIKERSSSTLDEVVIEDEDGKASLHEFLSDVVLSDGSASPENGATKDDALATPGNEGIKADTPNSDTAVPQNDGVKENAVQSHDSVIGEPDSN